MPSMQTLPEGQVMQLDEFHAAGFGLYVVLGHNTGVALPAGQ